MKNILCLLLVCSSLFTTGLFGQTELLQSLQGEAKAASGVARVEKYIALSEAYMQAGDFSKAQDAASEAEDFAKRMKTPELRAVALNLQGKALMASGKRGAFGGGKPAPRFEQSYEILKQIRSGNKALMLDNLQNLRTLAAKSGKSSEVAEIDGRIAKLEGRSPESPGSESNPLPPGLEEQINRIAEQNSDFAKQLEKLQVGNNKSATPDQANKYREMQMQLAQSMARIDEMSNEQMQDALFIAEQRTMLDSLMFQTISDSLSLTIYESNLKVAESTRKFNIAAMIALLLLTGGSFFSYFRARQNAKILEAKNKIIREEQQRSDNLLLNILPALVADELKKLGRTNARYFEDVCVLFADFVGFSKIAEKLTPQQLVTELDTCFQAFDQIMAKYSLEKIKTIGDAYMVAGGLADGDGNKLRDMIEAARDMQMWLHEWNIERDKKGLPRFDARIGIHRGPVVAGVVGSKKFAFDIWGDTVNIAARIEQASEGGKINISGEVYNIIKGDFPCHYRGKIAAKNKGEIDMYFVEN